MCRGKSPLLLNWTHIGAESALFKGAICERAEILGAVLAPINFKVAPVVFKFTLHVVQFGPYNGVDSAPKLVPKTAPFQWGRIDPKQVPNWTHSFWPHFWGQISSFNFTVYNFTYTLHNLCILFIYYLCNYTSCCSLFIYPYIYFNHYKCFVNIMNY